MPVGPLTSGGLGGVDFRSPFVDNETSSTPYSFAAGSYGDGAKILLILGGRSGYPAATPKQSFTITMSGGPVTVTAASPYAVNGSKPTLFVNDPNNYVVFAWIVEPNGWSFDSGSTLTITYQKATAYVLTGTVSATPPSGTMTGVGTRFTTELAILSGQRWLWLEGYDNPHLPASPGFYANVSSVTDDTHCTFSGFADSPILTNGQLTATISPSMVFIAGLLTFASPPLVGTGVTTAALYGSTTGTSPLYADGTATWTSTTSASRFGLLTDALGTRFDSYLADASVVEGYAIMQCLSTTGPDTVSMSGTGSWTNIDNAGGQALGSSGHITQGIARWTRPSILETSYAWSNFPASTFGHGFFLLFTATAVGVGHSFAVIMA